MKRQTEELEQQAAILDGKIVKSSSEDKTQSYEQLSSKDKKEVGTVGNTKIKTRLSPVDDDDADDNEEKYLVTVIRHEPFEGPIVIQKENNDQEINVSYKASHNIFIEPDTAQENKD